MADARTRKGWSPKTVQNWIRTGKLAVIAVGVGRSAKFIVRTADVDAMPEPVRGRPAVQPAVDKPKKGWKKP